SLTHPWNPTTCVSGPCAERLAAKHAWRHLPHARLVPTREAVKMAADTPRCLASCRVLECADRAAEAPLSAGLGGRRVTRRRGDRRPPPGCSGSGRRPPYSHCPSGIAQTTRCRVAAHLQG